MTDRAAFTDLESPPVLLLIDNRADLTKQVFDRIREVRPRRLFIAADGPRVDRPDDDTKCAETRAIVHAVDWDCDVHTLLRDRNLGCKLAVSSAISWFFEHVEEGIILEDDCVPHATFFRYCAELLARYRNDARVMAIGGNDFRTNADPRWAGRAAVTQAKSNTDSSDTPPDRASYTFAAHNLIWGWATWRRAWAHYDGALSEWSRLRETSWLDDFLKHVAAARYWRAVFDRDARGEIDTWDFAWTFSCWTHNGLTIHPAVNMVSNVGFDERAAHTRNAASPLANVPARAMPFPLVHPSDVRRDYALDRFTAEYVHRVRLRTSRWRRLLHRLREIRLRRVRRLAYRIPALWRADS